MAKKSDSSKIDGMRPAMNPEARENQLIALAMNVAEKRLRDGSATSAEVVHFLKLGSTKERMEKEILEKQKSLIDAKTDSLKNIKSADAQMSEIMNAIKKYSGIRTDDEQND